ncbi:hypothetical protein QOT17_015882 [Balamuthia mandrillaris]
MGLGASKTKRQRRNLAGGGQFGLGEEDEEDALTHLHRKSQYGANQNSPGLTLLEEILLEDPSAEAREYSLGYLSLLPDECIIHVLSLCSIDDLSSVCCASKCLFRFSRLDNLWRCLYFRELRRFSRFSSTPDLPLQYLSSAGVKLPDFLTLSPSLSQRTPATPLKLKMLPPISATSSTPPPASFLNSPRGFSTSSSLPTTTSQQDQSLPHPQNSSAHSNTATTMALADEEELTLEPPNSAKELLQMTEHDDLAANNVQKGKAKALAESKLVEQKRQALRKLYKNKWREICLKNSVLVHRTKLQSRVPERLIITEGLLGWEADKVLDLFGHSDEIVSVGRNGAYYYFNALGLMVCLEDERVSSILKHFPISSCDGPAFAKIVPIL